MSNEISFKNLLFAGIGVVGGYLTIRQIYRLFHDPDSYDPRRNPGEVSIKEGNKQQDKYSEITYYKYGGYVAGHIVLDKSNKMYVVYLNDAVELLLKEKKKEELKEELKKLEDKWRNDLLKDQKGAAITKRIEEKIEKEIRRKKDEYLNEKIDEEVFENDLLGKNLPLGPFLNGLCAVRALDSFLTGSDTQRDFYFDLMSSGQNMVFVAMDPFTATILVPYENTILGTISLSGEDVVLSSLLGEEISRKRYKAGVVQSIIGHLRKEHQKKVEKQEKETEKEEKVKKEGQKKEFSDEYIDRLIMKELEEALHVGKKLPTHVSIYSTDTSKMRPQVWYAEVDPEHIAKKHRVPIEKVIERARYLAGARLDPEEEEKSAKRIYMREHLVKTPAMLGKRDKSGVVLVPVKKEIGGTRITAHKVVKRVLDDDMKEIFKTTKRERRIVTASDVRPGKEGEVSHPVRSKVSFVLSRTGPRGEVGYYTSLLPSAIKRLTRAEVRALQKEVQDDFNKKYALHPSITLEDIYPKLPIDSTRESVEEELLDKLMTRMKMREITKIASPLDIKRGVADHDLEEMQARWEKLHTEESKKAEAAREARELEEEAKADKEAQKKLTKIQKNGISGDDKKYARLSLAIRVSQDLGIDWSRSRFPMSEFARGMIVELEHGLMSPKTNITDDDIYMTAKIAWAHLNEIPDYYTRLDEMERVAKQSRTRRGGWVGTW
jgi:hypothetical protein